MNELSRAEAIELCGVDAVNRLDRLNCEPTSRCMPDGQKHLVEFTARAKELVAVYYQNAKDIYDTCKELHELDWRIDHYRIYWIGRAHV